MSGTGWTVAGQAADSTGSHQTFVLDHTVTAADLAAGQVNLTVSVPADLVGLLTDYHHGTGVDVTATGSDPAATSQPFPTLTTTRDADTVVHVAGYDQQATGIAPAGDTARGAVSNLLAGLEVSDRYQDLPGPSAPASGTSATTAAAQVLTIALSAAATTTRYGYTGETDTAAFTQTSTGQPTGTSLTLPGGALYTTTPGGTPTWAHANLHGDVITTTDNTGTRTWTGYWGPYGEPASTTAGGTPDTTDPGTTLGYNATQGKLTDGPLILMGARPYQPDQGRFLTVDPIDGGLRQPLHLRLRRPPQPPRPHRTRNRHPSALGWLRSIAPQVCCRSTFVWRRCAHGRRTAGCGCGT